MRCLFNGLLLHTLCRLEAANDDAGDSARSNILPPENDCFPICFCAERAAAVVDRSGTVGRNTHAELPAIMRSLLAGGVAWR